MKLTSLIILVFLTQCKTAAPQSDGRGLDIVNSNIVAPTIDVADITELKLLPNTNIPKGFIVSMQKNNLAFLKQLYGIIHKINTSENLAGLEGYQQEITMVLVSIVGNKKSVYQRLAKDIKETHGLTSEKIPYLVWLKGGTDEDLWMQDWGEFAVIKIKGETKRYHAVMDVSRGREINAKDFSKVFGIPFVKISALVEANSGNYGGNTEATHEGKLYFGDKLTDASMINKLRALGNTDAIEIPSKWLSVGHVDEYTTFIPAATSCNAALIVASPLEAINLMAQMDPALVKKTIYNVDFKKILKADLIDPSKNPPYEVDDFKDGTKTFIQRNIRIERIARFAAAKLKKNSNCLEDIVTVPQIYKRTGKRKKLISLLGGTTNMLVLRDHVIIPEPFFNNKFPVVEAFKQVIIKKLGKLLNGEHKVHFIDTTYYHNLAGEIHCGTNVIREIDMPVIVQ